MPTSPPDVADILTEAVEIDSPAAREAFLEQACGGDAQLKARIVELVRMHFLAGNFLEQPATDVAETLRRSAARAGIGTRIGPYQLLQEIGEGGMGVVYMAQQDRPVQRRVALKVIKPGMDTRQVIARFEAERQALAMMDHPNIARVFDAGMTETGRPYFVMELINGVPITRYCDEHHLGPTDRLRLFLPVCHAVQHAHQKGIIHRDLKPSNVLVAQYDNLAVPKVIDFGVAKAISQQLTDLTLFTEFGQVMGTFEYMSPEQARRNQLDVDTRTDVYSLGVILYELLTGATPFDAARFRQAAIDEILRIIDDEEPPRPSLKLSGSQSLPSVAANRRLDPARLSRFVQGDLDWIVMRSLEKERGRRYSTVAALAADVDRFLNDEPVEARPPSAVYRLQKLASRHTGVFISASLIALLLIIGTLISTWQAIRATRAERRAELLAELANRNAATAVQSRDRAEIERLNAENREFVARRRRYETNLLTAREAIQRNDAATARARLNQELPEPNSTDIRTFGWHYLRAQCDLELATLRGHSGPVVGLAYSPDGRMLATASDDLTIRLWDVDRQTWLRTLKGHEQPVVSVAFSPDGALLASVGDDETIRLWDSKSGKSLAVLTGHVGNVRAVAFSPDGSLLATGGTDTVIRLWHVAERRQVGELHGHVAELNQIVFSPDGTRLASSADDETVRIWNVETRSPIAVLKGHVGHVRGVAFSPDGALLASGGRDATIKLWSTAAWNKLGELHGHTAGVQGVAFAPDGASLASAGEDRAVRFWDVATRQSLGARIGHAGRVYPVAFAPDGRTLASAGADAHIKFWEAPDPRAAILKGHVSQANAVAFSADGHWLASAGWDNQVRLWDTATHREVRSLAGHKFGLMSTAFAPDAQTLASADGGGTIRLWNPDNGELRRELPAHESAIRHLAFSGDGSLLASASDDQTIKIWQMPDGAPLGTLDGHRTVVHAVAFLPGSSRLISAGQDATVGIWDLNSWSMVGRREGPGGVMTAVAATPDGRLIAAGSRDGAIQLWDAQTLSQIGELRGHLQQVQSLAFSSDGAFLVSGSNDQTVRLWDIATGLEVATLVGHAGHVNGVAIAPDEALVASASSDSTVRLWELRTAPGGETRSWKTSPATPPVTQ